MHRLEAGRETSVRFDASRIAEYDEMYARGALVSRSINARIDTLFVEGPDDGAVVNALVKKRLGLELARRPYLVRVNEEGGGDSWALRELERHIATAQSGARVGAIVDRDTVENDKWPAVSALLRRLGARVARRERRRRLRPPRPQPRADADAGLRRVPRLVHDAVPDGLIRNGRWSPVSGVQLSGQRLSRGTCARAMLLGSSHHGSTPTRRLRASFDVSPGGLHPRTADN